MNGTDTAEIVEALAAQLYERDVYVSAKRPRFWTEISDAQKVRWRKEARRKLRTGQIPGSKDCRMAQLTEEGRPTASRLSVNVEDNAACLSNHVGIE